VCGELGAAALLALVYIIAGTPQSEREGEREREMNRTHTFYGTNVPMV